MNFNRSDCLSSSRNGCLHAIWSRQLCFQREFLLIGGRWLRNSVKLTGLAGSFIATHSGISDDPVL
jgi:hypothetical protein